MEGLRGPLPSHPSSGLHWGAPELRLQSPLSLALVLAPQRATAALPIESCGAQTQDYAWVAKSENSCPLRDLGHTPGPDGAEGVVDACVNQG